MTDLRGRTCLVTGGSRGIGRAIALELGRCGASVAVGFVSNEEGAERVAAEIATHGGTAFAFGCDVQDAEAVEKAVANVVERFGKIDALVNNAGITRDRSLAKMSPEEWGDVIQTNLTSVFQMTSRVLPHMVQAGYGRIVNISSVIGVHGNFGQANYAAAKAGIIGFTKSAALEVARKGVTVNAIAPGRFWTKMTDAVFSDDRLYDSAVRVIPMGRPGVPTDLAGAAVLLASDAGAYITGQTIVIDGGWLASGGVDG